MYNNDKVLEGDKMNATVYFIIYLSLFILMNVFNTYFLTRQQLNRYIAPFKHRTIPEINSFLGNLSSLSILIILTMFLIEKVEVVMLVLLIMTVLINMFNFALSVFNLYYGTAFTKVGLEIFKNPTKGISKGMVTEIFKELIMYYRIILFLPTFTLLIMYMLRDRSQFMNFYIDLNNYIIFGLLSASIMFLIFSGLMFERLFLKTLPIASVRSTYAIQSFGLYPYYFVHIFGWKHKLDLRKVLKVKTDEDLYKLYDKINKNKHTYTNQIDGKTYHNRLTFSKLNPNIHIDKTLIDNKKDLHGILKGRNLVLVQVESMNAFLNMIPSMQEKMPFLNALKTQSVVFENFYTSVGIGVSSDAEIATLTGLYPSGISNLYWQDFNSIKKEYTHKAVFETLPKYFKQAEYKACAFHGDHGSFYNRKNAYDKIIGFDSFTALEDIKNLKPYKTIAPYPLFVYPYKKDFYHISPWLSDVGLAEMVTKQSLNESNKHFYFPITMMPHTPFEFHPEADRDLFSDLKVMNRITKKYINFVDYYDEIFKSFFMNNGDSIIDGKTVYLFYGDHGSGLKNGDLNVLFERKTKMSNLEERKHLLQVEALLYVPSDEKIQVGEYTINKGLITGHQEKVRGHIDIYRTIIELFDLNRRNDLYYGTHLLSTEPTFVIDNKLLDVVLDDMFYSMRYPLRVFPSDKKVDEGIFNIIKEVKQLNDLLHQDSLVQMKVNAHFNKEEKK